MSISNVLQAPRRTAADRAWGELGLRDAAAAHATTTLVPGAAVLPLTTFLDANVYPVVVWDRRALSARLTRMDGPAVSTDAVRDLLDAGCPTALRVANGRGLTELNACRVVDQFGGTHVEQAVRAIGEKRHQIRKMRVPR